MKNKTIWSNRFENKTSLSFQKIGSSIHIDKRLYEQDIAASIVHTQMLSKFNELKYVSNNLVDYFGGVFSEDFTQIVLPKSLPNTPK